MSASAPIRGRRRGLPGDGSPALPLAQTTVVLCQSAFNDELAVGHSEEYRTTVRDLLLDALPRTMGPEVADRLPNTGDARQTLCRATLPKAPTTAPRANMAASSSSMWTIPAGTRTR
ncbi:hypothetical protein GCM10007079_24090 [Nocardiopsis terrae]|nr:hypothetical protein GCM10007079_24090 [Nocardiopsis terrae]